MVSITTDGLVRIFEGKTVTESARMLLPNLLYKTSYSCDFTDARWREQTMDDDMLRKLIIVHDGKEDIKLVRRMLNTLTAWPMNSWKRNGAYSLRLATFTSWRMGRRNMPSLRYIGKASEKNIGPRRGRRIHLRIFAPSNPSGGVLIYLEEPERREGFEGLYYEF